MIMPSMKQFDYYGDELIKISRYSAAYLLEYVDLKNNYLREISQVVRLIRSDFQIALYNYNQGRQEYWADIKRCIAEIRMELDAERYGYEQGRKKDRKTYLKTQEYSGKGFLFYGKNGLKVIGGIVQFGAGVMSFRTKVGGGKENGV